MKKEKTQIKSDILIAELVELYPIVAEFLIDKYEFHCVNCVLAGFETLEEGAGAHGIVGKSFTKMLKDINKLVQDKKVAKK